MLMSHGPVPRILRNENLILTGNRNLREPSSDLDAQADETKSSSAVICSDRKAGGTAKANRDAAKKVTER